MKQVNWFLFFLFISTVVGCKYKEGSREVQVKDQFQVSIPYYLSETKSLGEHIPFQYQNRYRNFYVISLDEPKSTSKDLESYTNQVIQSFEMSLEKAKASTPEKDTINGLPALATEITGKRSGHKVFYLLTTLEGSEHYYQLCQWTLLKKKEEHIDTFHQIVDSFKEI